APTGAATQVGEQGLFDRVVVGVGLAFTQGGETSDDARRAEPALRRTGGTERVGPVVGRLQSVDGGDRATTDPTHGGDARDTRRAVDEDGATPTLALWTAAVLGAADAERIPQGVEQGAGVWNLDVGSVHHERDRRNGTRRRGVGGGHDGH